jgi:hypothetical protein
VRFASAAGRWVLVVAVLGEAMVLLEATVVNVALPAIGRDLGAGVAGLQWTLNGYVLTLAALVLAAGSLSDLYGRRRVFTLGVGAFVAASALCGAGKTTISYLIPRLYDVTGGSVQIDDVDVRHVRQASLAAAIGFVTQESYLFHDSILANIRYGRPVASMAEVEEAARAAYIHDRVMEFPDGYDAWHGPPEVGPSVICSISVSAVGLFLQRLL